MKPLAPEKVSLKAAINLKLALFLHAFRSALLLTGMLALVGLLMKFTHLAGEQVVFGLAMSLLALLFLLQTGLSFVFSHPKMAFLGAFSSLAVALSCMTLVFVYENWWGTHLMVILTSPLLLISSGFLLNYFLSGEHRHTTHRKFLYINILSPYLFIALLWLAFLIRHEVRERRTQRVAGQTGLGENGTHFYLSEYCEKAQTFNLAGSFFSGIRRRPDSGPKQTAKPIYDAIATTA